MATDMVLEPRIILETVQWTKLQQIEDLEPIGDDDYAVLAELREVLVRRGFEKRFGVCLLHKHFEIGPDEAAMEESDEEARTSTISVVPLQEAQEATETAWQFSAYSDEITAGRRCNIYCRGFGQTGHSRQHACEGFK